MDAPQLGLLRLNLNMLISISYTLYYSQQQQDVFLCIRICTLFNFVSLELYPEKYLMQFTLQFKVLENLFYPYT